MSVQLSLLEVVMTLPQLSPEDGSLMSKSPGLLDEAPHFTHSLDQAGPSVGLRTCLESGVLTVIPECVSAVCFANLLFPFTANDKIEDINGCPKNRSQMVSGVGPSVVFV